MCATNGIHLGRPQPLTFITVNSIQPLKVMVSVLNAETNQPIDGYGRQNCVHMNVDEQQLPLLWSSANNSNPSSSALPPSIPAGKNVRLRVYFRDASVYALGAF
jgi:hypothetical protein